jgi:hypothetical protein
MGPVPILRRLLAVLFVAGACLLAGPGSSATAAVPCTCAGPQSEIGPTVEDHVKAASAVFEGTVEEVTALGGNAQDGVSRTSSVRVDKVFKPRDYELITTDEIEVMTPASFGQCARELQRGETYIFFVESNEGFTAAGCGGTSVVTAKLTTQVERLLGAGRDPVPPEPATATFTSANTDDPTSLTRVAAPGVALVLVGLLGLAVVRRLGRPRS